MIRAHDYYMCRRGHAPRRTRHLYWSLDSVTGERIGEGRRCLSCGGVWALMVGRDVELAYTMRMDTK